MSIKCDLKIIVSVFLIFKFNNKIALLLLNCQIKNYFIVTNGY